jgi:hypothetical protein
MPRPQKKYHYIYKTTCKITGKFYVGMHSTNNLEDGYLGSGKILGYSRNKYGDENHIREILEMLPSREALKAREKEIVNEELLADPLNINLKYGGDGGFTSDTANKNWANQQYRKKIIDSLKITSSKNWENDDYRNKVTKSLKITLSSTEQRTRLKNIGNWIGKKHTDETRAIMRMSHLGKHDGEKNSQFGTCWVNNGNIPIKIKKEFLEEYLQNGYTRGRKLRTS